MEDYIKDIAHSETHVCCPKEDRSIPNITGSYELDAVIERSKNKDMLSRLSMYIKGNIYNSGDMDK
jgi:hypothetical protein